MIVAKTRIGKPLLAADEVRELHRVADEEDRRVVAHQIVIAFVRVELERKAAHVAPGVGAAHLAGDRGETRQHLGGRALPEQRRPGVCRDILGGLEDAERARALGVRLALGHLLAVEMRHLLEKVHVVKQDGPIGADRQRVAVARRRRTGAHCGTDRLIIFRCGHAFVLLCLNQTRTSMFFLMRARGPSRHRVNHVPLDLLNALTQQELRRRGTPPMVVLGIEEINGS